MGIREVLADRWSKAGKRSGSHDFKYLSTVDASITLLRDDGESLRASSEAIDGTEVQKFLGRSFEALVVPSFKSGIPDEDSISVIISAGKELSENDDFVRIVTKDMPVTGRGVSVGGPLVGLDLTFPAKVSSAGGFITGELFSNGHYYYCVVVLFIGKKQI